MKSKRVINIIIILIGFISVFLFMKPIDSNASDYSVSLSLVEYEDNPNEIASNTTFKYYFYAHNHTNDGRAIINAQGLLCFKDRSGKSLGSYFTATFDYVKRPDGGYLGACVASGGSAYMISYGNADTDYTNYPNLQTAKDLLLGTITINIKELPETVTSGTIFLRTNDGTSITLIDLTNYKNKTVYKKTNCGVEAATHTYNLKVPSSDPSLAVGVNGSNLALDNGEYKYTLKANETKATISLAGSDGASVTSIVSTDGKTYSGSSFDVNVNPGETVALTISTLADDGITAGSYKIIISRAKDNDSRLKNLSFSATGTNLPLKLYNEANTEVKQFSSNTNKYTLRIPAVTEKIRLVPTANSSYIKSIKVNDNTVASGDSCEIVYSASLSSIKIVVTAQDDSTTVYELAIYKMSNDTSLKSLSIVDDKGNKIELDSNYNSIKNVDYSVQYFLVTSVLNSSTAVGGLNAKKISFTSNSEDTKSCEFTVTAEDGTAKTYVIRVTRNAGKSNNELEKLVLNGKTIDLNKLSIVDLNLLDKAVTIDSITISDGATYRLSGVTKYSRGLNNVSIVVTSQTNISKEYIIKVFVAGEDYSLNTVEFKDSNNNIISDYTFDEATNTYRMSVDYLIESATPQIVLNDINASISGNGNSVLVLEAGKTNSFSFTVASELYKYDNTCGQIKTYTIEIFRAAGETGADLKTLVINGKSITNLSALEDIIVIDEALEGQTVQITYTVSSKANVNTIKESDKFKRGLNTIKIEVSSEDGAITNTYNIKVYVASQDSSISGIRFLGDGNEITYNKDNNTYSMTVANNISLFNVELIISSAKATCQFDRELPYTLEVGENTITVVIKSEYSILSGDTKNTSTYSIVINKEAKPSNDNSQNGNDKPDSNQQESNNTVLMVLCISFAALALILAVALLAVRALKKNKFEDNMKKR